MIGFGLKKFAGEHDMTIENGMAYGNFRGYAVTFSEGAGYKLCVITAKFQDSADRDAFISFLKTQDLYNPYRVEAIMVLSDCIFIMFYDCPGTMKKIRTFCDWFFQLLPAYHPTDIHECSQCGKALDDTAVWKASGEAAFLVHEACAACIDEKNHVWEENTDDIKETEDQDICVIHYTMDSAALDVDEIHVFDPEGILTFTDMNAPSLKWQCCLHLIVPIAMLLLLLMPVHAVRACALCTIGLYWFITARVLPKCLVREQLRDLNQMGNDSVLIGKTHLRKLQREEAVRGGIFLILGIGYFIGICIMVLG